MNLSPQGVAKALGGEARGCHVLAPGPGHLSPRDRSLSVLVDPQAPDGFVVMSFAGDDVLQCKDYVRERLGIEVMAARHEPRQAGDTPAPRSACGSFRKNRAGLKHLARGKTDHGNMGRSLSFGARYRKPGQPVLALFPMRHNGPKRPIHSGSCFGSGIAKRQGDGGADDVP